ncbi:hypothetical protein BVY03_02600 [bacterium K02(2017)]|nr:hypothetical protein BVY03_02600 [bacterium K02(2017)]
MSLEQINKILDYWLANSDQSVEELTKQNKLWFVKNPDTDLFIKNNFEADIIKAKKGLYDSWKSSPQGNLALIILFDQFTRNIYRNTENSFATDPLALQISQNIVSSKKDEDYSLIQRVFIYLPFEHSEDIKMQETSLTLFTKLKEQASHPFQNYLNGTLNYAISHYDIIKRFGRFPHRNIILERESTTEEIDFLNQPGSSF